jgi:uncharacterized protein YecA (UPF0149 family)
MTTQSRIDANRVNSLSSTGPRTGEGKAASSRNATRHGLSTGVLFIEGEDPQDYELLLKDLLAEHQPATATETALVLKMAQQLWFTQRATRLLQQAVELNTIQDNAKQVALMLRYQTAADRSFYKALDELRKLQKEKRSSTIGFVSKSGDATAASNRAPAPIGFVSQPDSQNAAPRNAPCPCGSGLKYKRCCLGKPLAA